MVNRTRTAQPRTMHRGKDDIITCRDFLSRAFLRTAFGTLIYFPLGSWLACPGRRRGLHLGKLLIVFRFRQMRILALLSKGAVAVLEELVAVTGDETLASTRGRGARF